MTDGSVDLDGVKRAAVLLLSLGEQDAAEVLRHMGPREVQKLGITMANLEDISQTQVNGVLEDFLDSVGNHTALGMDSQSYIRNVLVRALGEEKARGLVDRISLGSSAQGLEMLKWMEPRAVADILRDEHPQIVAIVLAYLDEEQSGVILSLLPEPLRAEVLMRVATLDSVQPAALHELNEILEVQMSNSGKGQSANVGGVKTAATILNFMDGHAESELIEKVKEKDLDLGQQIQDFMFVFEDLIDIDDASIQALIREISSESLLLALKGSEEKLKEKFFRNVSRRAAEMLRDDLEAQGPVRVSEVDNAQREILSIARRMADDGQIVLGGRGASEFL